MACSVILGINHFSILTLFNLDGTYLFMTFDFRTDHQNISHFEREVFIKNAFQDLGSMNQKLLFI